MLNRRVAFTWAQTRKNVGLGGSDDGPSEPTVLAPRRSLPFPSPLSFHFYPSSRLLDMSTAHRPTWDPAQAKDVKGGSRQFSVRDMPAHTKLKFRYVSLLLPSSQQLVCSTLI